MPYHVLLFLLFALFASSCAHYGWADRPTQGASLSGLKVHVATVSAAPDRRVDVDAVTLELIERVQQCSGAQTLWASRDPNAPFLQCKAIIEERVLGEMTSSYATLLCTLSWGDEHHKVQAHSTSTTSRRAQDRPIHASAVTDTHALLAASRQISCPITHMLRAHFAPKPHSS